jgi:endothelin-converting enzyme
MMNKITLAAAGVCMALGLSACNHSANTEAAIAMNSGIEIENFDHSVRPQDDFYRYVDGSWLKRTKIPADKSNYGSFTQLHDDAQLRLRRIIETTAAQPHKVMGSDEQKLGDFYNSYMDEVYAEKLGLLPIKPELEKIAGLHSHQQLSHAFAYFNHLSVKTPFAWYVDNDPKHSTEYAVTLTQSGLGLPDRDYYLKDTAKFAKIRQDYQAYIGEVLALAGNGNAATAAKEIVLLETEIAKAHWSRVENRDPVKAYNKLSVSEIDKLMGAMRWPDYAQAAHLDKAAEVIVRQPTYLSQLSDIFNRTALKTWKNYLSFHLVNDYAQSMNKNLADLHFNFFSKRLRGVEAQQPRWKRAIAASDAVLGEVLGKLYVKETFTPEAKQRMTVMVKNLIKAYGKRIDQLEWMSAKTKKAAQQKLAKFTYKIGYPDQWKDYSALQIKAGDLVGNGMRGSRWAHDDMAQKLGKPMDKAIWHMTPQTVNAYYNPVMNEVVFPAAILQPPFFNMAAEDAVNYGAIGAVIGHELGHGFDDSGSKYDGDGNLRNWWGESDKREFEKRGKQFAAQYNGFKPFDDASVNGQLTLGENIGDLGGLVVAFEAYQIALNGKLSPEIDGFNGNQRFFFGWAQVWRRNYREEELRQRLMTDSHSPSEYRVNGIMANMPQFYQTFNVQPGDKLYLEPKNRINIW